jgi:putative acyl-CoA dehydrogenase
MAWQTHEKTHEKTHEIHNVVDELVGINLFETDRALRDAVGHAGAASFAPALGDYGARIGSAEAARWADEANRFTPELKAFDARGRRIDQVAFHPGWHALLSLYRENGWLALPFDSERPGRWAAQAAAIYLHAQVEHGTMCPIAMTQACMPLLMREPGLSAQLTPKLFDRTHDPRDVPIDQKPSIWVGMGMTEKQGGSDVRSNTTTATPVAAGGRGGEYLLRGHKWFFSAPMCDAHLVTAQTDAGPGCFFVPRWRPARNSTEPEKNTVQIQRLKHKVGNRSNASSEVEFADAWGLLISEEGRGIRTIIEMASITRLYCVVASAGLMRQALVQALHWARRRKVFGRALVEQPLMRSVLADIALESEAALVLAMRLAEAFEHGEAAWMRLLTPAAKFWVCKRAITVTGEAMEVLGGNGYVDDGVVARLYREAPVNSIWEGSGNVMGLDVLRALGKEPDAVRAWFDELADTAKDDTSITAELRLLHAQLHQPGDDLQAQGRLLVQRLVVVTQACLLRRHSPSFVADAFVATRLAEQGSQAVVGAIDPRGFDIDALLVRALPG